MFAHLLPEVGDVGGAALFRGLVNKPNLEELSAGACGLGREAGLALAQVLPGMTSLRDLWLDENKLDAVAAEALPLFGSAGACTSQFVMCIW